MKSPIDTVVIIVPAHNEERRIAATMESIAKAAATVRVDVRSVLVLDACADATHDAVQSVAVENCGVEWFTVLTDQRRASSAREVGLDFAISQLGRRRPPVVAVLSTDADTTVPASWISDHVRCLDAGADAVAGIVELEPSETSDVSETLWRAEYTSGFQPDGTHPHVHCANLAVRLDALVRAGGFGHAERAEDIDLWKRLNETRRATLISTQTSVVTTSRRLNGRVHGGFATALQQFRHPELEPARALLRPAARQPVNDQAALRVLERSTGIRPRTNDRTGPSHGQ